MSITILGHGPRHARRAADESPVDEPDLAAPLVMSVVEDAQRRLAWAQSPDAPEGEHIVRRSLDIVRRYGWTGLEHVTWSPTQEGTGHIVVGPGGVVVVDERLWTEPVRVEDGVLRRGGFRCERELAALADAVAAVTALLPPEHRTAVSGVVCVTARDLEPQPVGGAHVVGRLHLAGHLVTLEPRLDPVAVADVTRSLHRALDAAQDAADGDVPTQLPIDAPSAGVFVPAPVAPPTAVDPAAYFGSRPAQPTRWADEAAGRPAWVEAGPVPAPYPQRWRAAAARVTIAVLVGLLTYQNSGTITTAVGEWMGTDVVTSVRASD